jgi:hypothetical protein
MEILLEGEALFLQQEEGKRNEEIKINEKDTAIKATEERHYPCA